MNDKYISTQWILVGCIKMIDHMFILVSKNYGEWFPNLTIQNCFLQNFLSKICILLEVPKYLISVFLVPHALELLRVPSKYYLYVYSSDNVPVLSDPKESLLILKIILTRSQIWCKNAVFLYYLFSHMSNSNLGHK